MAEIHRGGLLSVAEGQSEAGHALSFSFIGIQRLIVRSLGRFASLPTLINEYITIVKLSSIRRWSPYASCCSPASASMRKFPCGDGDPAGGSGVLRWWLPSSPGFPGVEIVSIFSVSVRKPSARRNARRCARAFRR